MYINLTDFWGSNGPFSRDFCCALLVEREWFDFRVYSQSFLEPLRHEWRTCEDELVCVSAAPFALKDAS
jgi:hypothetical protein